MNNGILHIVILLLLTTLIWKVMMYEDFLFWRNRLSGKGADDFHSWLYCPGPLTGEISLFSREEVTFWG